MREVQFEIVEFPRRFANIGVFWEIFCFWGGLGIFRIWGGEGIFFWGAQENRFFLGCFGQFPYLIFVDLSRLISF